MFSNKMIAGILIPVVLEQLLNSIMGTADTMMVSNLGSIAGGLYQYSCDTGIFGTGSRRSNCLFTVYRTTE